jgi:hypothetical protein
MYRFSLMWCRHARSTEFSIWYSVFRGVHEGLVCHLLLYFFGVCLTISCFCRSSPTRLYAYSSLLSSWPWVQVCVYESRTYDLSSTTCMQHLRILIRVSIFFMPETLCSNYVHQVKPWGQNMRVTGLFTSVGSAYVSQC